MAKSSKSVADKQVYDNAMQRCIEEKLIQSFEDFNIKTTNTLLGDRLQIMILEAIKYISEKAQVNVFPSNKWILYDDKTTKKSKSKPVSKESVEEIDSIEEEVKEPKKDKKSKGKRNITQINKNAKTVLFYWVGRFFYEIFSTTDVEAKSIKNLEDFNKNILSSRKLNEITSSITPLIISIAMAYKPVIVDGDDDVLITKLKERFVKAFKDQKKKLDYAVDIVAGFFKAMAFNIAHMLWVKPFATNAKVLETSFRTMSLAGDAWLAENSSYPGRSNVDNGIMELTKTVDSYFNPAATKKVPSPKAEKEDKKVSKNRKSEEDSDKEEEEKKEEPKAKSVKKPIKRVVAKKQVKSSKASKKEESEDEENEDEDEEDEDGIPDPSDEDDE